MFRKVTDMEDYFSESMCVVSNEQNNFKSKTICLGNLGKKLIK